jgi:hypothetical protein
VMFEIAVYEEFNLPSNGTQLSKSWIKTSQT